MRSFVANVWRVIVACLRRTRVSISNSYPLLALIYVGVLVLLLSHAGPARHGKASSYQQQNISIFRQDEANKEIVFFIILCEGVAQNSQGGEAASAITRQLRQAAVMLKSAAALTSTTLRFLVVADSEKLYHRFTSLTSAWPAEYQKLVVFEWHPVWYPDEREDMRSMFRVCATERLFLPEMFPSLDAAIYIDTDLIFMRPPEDLWMEFQKFDEIQVAAMAPCLYHYGMPKNRVPFYGESGLNAGVMHMNLTRMKYFPGGGWTAANLKAFDTFKRTIKLADQDILNILFHKYPDHVYELGCEWNYRIFQCSQGYNKCPAAYHSGISILHGNAMAFISGKEMKLQTVFETWEEHRLGEPLSHLLSQMEEKLERVSSYGLPSKCARTRSIDDMLTKALKNQVF